MRGFLGNRAACSCVVAVIVSVCAPTPSAAQSGCPWSNWLGGTRMVGALVMTGTASGVDSFGDKVELKEKITALPDMTGFGSLSWTGPLNATVEYSLKVVSANGQNVWTTVANGPAIASGGGPGQATFGIDPVSCNATLFDDSQVSAIYTEPHQNPATIVIGWGPITTPLGASIAGGFPLSDLALPATGTTFDGQLSYDALDSDSYQYGVPAHWIVQWNIHPAVDCVANVPQIFWQGSSPWGGDTYGNTTHTVAEKGCAMTTLLMGLMSAGFTGRTGVSADPRSVNEYLTAVGDLAGTEGELQWDPAARAISGGTLKYNELGGRLNTVDNFVDAKKLLDDALCSATPHPVIVGINFKRDESGALKRTDGQPVPGHYVLVTEKHGTTYTVADPATGAKGTLPAQFATRGVVQDPPGDISALDLGINEPGSVLVIDPQNRRSGADPATGTMLEQIPGSGSIVDALDNDVTGVPATTSYGQVSIYQPPQGLYTVVVNGTAPGGPYSLRVRGFNQDGGAQPVLTAQGTASNGSVATYRLNYASTTGASTTLTPGQAIASAGTVTFSEGVRESFTVKASGSTVPVVALSGSLPTGVTFTDNHDGTGTLAGTPATGTAGAYPLTLTASSACMTATQAFTLDVTSSAVSLRVTKNATGIVLSWTGTATSYTVRRGVDGAFTVQDTTVSSAQTTTTFTDAVLADGRSYFYLVN